MVSDHRSRAALTKAGSSSTPTALLMRVGPNTVSAAEKKLPEPIEGSAKRTPRLRSSISESTYRAMSMARALGVANWPRRFRSAADLVVSMAA
jgi:hypothetical protein